MAYGKKIPVDINNTPDVLTPPNVVALQQFIASGAASSVITFHENATNLEVAAADALNSAGGLLLKWISSTDTTASVTGTNFDHFITSGQQPRRFVIPVEKIGTSSTVGANVKNGLYNRVAWMAHGTASVIATIY